MVALMPSLSISRYANPGVYGRRLKQLPGETWVRATEKTAGEEA
jgi:hypothetical protein